MKTATYDAKENKWTWNDAAPGTGCCCSGDREPADREARENLQEQLRKVNEEYREHYPIYTAAREKFLNGYKDKSKTLDEQADAYLPVKEKHQAYLKTLDELLTTLDELEDIIYA